MNWDLAIMALDGLVRSPLEIEVSKDTLRIRGDADSFKELARLCLLLGAPEVDAGEELELQRGVHVDEDSPSLTLKRSE